jgi:tetratricopeptide (TPR) repeat protein
MSSLRLITVAALALAACGPPHSAYLKTDVTPQEEAWDATHAAEISGRRDEAIDGYRAQCDAKLSYPRACYDLARALFDAGRTPEARVATERFIAEHPSNALAQPAASHLARSYQDAGDATAGIAALEGLARKVAGKDAWDSVVHEIAGLCRSAGDEQGERGALERIVAKGRWGSQLWDDSIWSLIELSAARGDRVQEEALLLKLISTREESRLVGSYNSHYHDDALLRLGRLYLEAGRLDRAADLFAELAHWETSRMRDDGYYWAAVVKVRQGRPDEACALLRKLLEKVPGSSSEDEARQLLREERCDVGAAGKGASQ